MSTLNKTYKCVYILKDNLKQRYDAKEFLEQFPEVTFANKNPETYFYNKVSVKDFYSLYLNDYNGPEVATADVLSKAMLQYSTNRLSMLIKSKKDHDKRYNNSHDTFHANLIAVTDASVQYWSDKV